MWVEPREEMIVSAADPKLESLQPFVDLMRAQGLSDPAIASFAMHVRRLRGGDQGTIAEDEIRPTGRPARPGSTRWW